MKNSIICLLLVFGTFSSGCNSEQADPAELFQVEKEFSEMSEQKGMHSAFLYFSHDSAVILQDNSMPMVGKDALEESFAGTSDTAFTLTWEPLQAHIAESGDLGYTFGIYKISFKADSIPDNKGTYVTVWKKSDSGEWRFLLDTGQQGLGDPEVVHPQ